MDKKKTETIFLVEDDPGVLEFVREVLSFHGYNVIAVSNAYEAVEVFKNNSSSIDMLLTDIVMPEMNGQALYSKLRSEREDLKALFMSGYPRENLANFIKEYKQINLINKPFSNSKLLGNIRSILDDIAIANGKDLPSDM